MGYGYYTKAENVAVGVDVKDKVIIVTGANTGIGLETARVLASRGAHVILGCRSAERGQAAVDQIKAAHSDAKLTLGELKLESLTSINKFVDWFLSQNLRLDVLINNAGIMALKQYETTDDGVEKQWGVNHLGHFHLTELLLPKLRESAPSRVVNVASEANQMAQPGVWKNARLPPTKEDYGPLFTYGDSKLSNIIHASELDQRELAAKTGVRAYSLHPGVIGTELLRSNCFYDFMFYRLGWLFGKSIPQGAATTIFCALESDNHGGYHADAKAFRMPKLNTEANRKMLWEVSEKLIAEKNTSAI